MNYVIYCLIMSFGFLTLELNAQWVVSNDFYQMNWQTMNPAALDRLYYIFADAQKSDNDPDMAMNMYGRPSWAGVEGAPQTGLLSFDYFIKSHANDNGWLKFGGSLLSDNIGGFKKTAFESNFAYKIILTGGEEFINLGFNAGFTKYSFYDVDNTNDPLFLRQANPPLLFTFTVGGFYLNTVGGFYIGPSLHFITQKQVFQNVDVIVGKYFDNPFDKRAVNLETSLIIQYHNHLTYTNKTNFLSGQFNSRAYFYNDSNQFTEKINFWLGIGIHSSGSCNIELGTILPHGNKNLFRFGLLTRFPMFKGDTQLTPTFLNNHEFHLTYTW